MSATICLVREDGTANRTAWRSLVSVKRWATRYRHVWRVEGEAVIVSCADGTVHRYVARDPWIRNGDRILEKLP